MDSVRVDSAEHVLLHVLLGVATHMHVLLHVLLGVATRRAVGHVRWARA